MWLDDLVLEYCEMRLRGHPNTLPRDAFGGFHDAHFGKAVKRFITCSRVEITTIDCRGWTNLSSLM